MQNFHNVNVKPLWRLSLQPVRKIGQHFYYRPHGEAAAAAPDEIAAAASAAVAAAPDARRGDGARPPGPRIKIGANSRPPEESGRPAKSADTLADDMMRRMRDGAN